MTCSTNQQHHPWSLPAAESAAQRSSLFYNNNNSNNNSNNIHHHPYEGKPSCLTLSFGKRVLGRIKPNAEPEPAELGKDEEEDDDENHGQAQHSSSSRPFHRPLHSISEQEEDHDFMTTTSCFAAAMPTLQRPQSRLLQHKSAGPTAPSKNHRNHLARSLPPLPSSAQNRVRGWYEGEMEPDGVRGQQATVVPPPHRHSRGGPDSILPAATVGDHTTTTTTNQTTRWQILRPGVNDDDDDVDDDVKDDPTTSKEIPHNKPPLLPQHSQYDTPQTFNPFFQSNTTTTAAATTTTSNSSNHVEKYPSSSTLLPMSQRRPTPPPSVPSRFVVSPQHPVPTTTNKATSTTNEPTTTDSSTTIQRSSSVGAHTATTAASSSTSPRMMMMGHPPPPRTTMASTPNTTPTATTNPHQQQQQHHPTVNVKALQSHAMELVQLGNYDMAVDVFAQVLHWQLQQYGTQHAATASAYHNLGTIHAKLANQSVPDSIFQQQHRTIALECFQAAARSARDSTLGPDHPNVAVSLVRVGFCLLQSKSYRPALITFQEALRIRHAHFGKFHNLTANIYNNIGICYMHLNEFEAGREALEDALEIQRHLVDKQEESAGVVDKVTHSPNHQNDDDNDDSSSSRATQWLELSDTLFNVGGLCLEWIRKQGPDSRHAIEAEQAFGEALNIRKRILGHDDAMVIQVVQMLEMAQATPRPRTPKQQQRSLMRHNHHHNNNNINNSTSSQKRPPPPLVSSLPSGTDVEPLPHLPISPILPHRTHNPSIFRTKKDPLPVLPPNMKRWTATAAAPTTNKKKAPISEIAVSKDQEYNADEMLLERKMDFVRSRQSMNPKNDNNNNDDVNQSDVALGTGSFERDTFCVDTSDDQLPIHQSIVDGEESCLISECGIESEQGKIHYPLAWKKANLSNDASKRDLVVSRPSQEAAKTSRIRARIRGKSTSTMASNNPTNHNKVSTHHFFSTGNKERDSVMARARAIINAHGPDGDHNVETVYVDENTASHHVNMIRNNNNNSSNLLDQDLPDDGLAPLGGDWGQKENDQFSRSSSRPTIATMLKNPATYLGEIYDEATRLLQRNEFMDAQRLFEVVLECQRHRHGLLHPDVAAALHNIGITHLRANNHQEALKAFEESSRVSLVKVGITLLLLRQFDEALWSFREALQVRKHALGPLHPSTARIYNNVGCVYVEFNEFKQARRSFEAALDIQRSALVHDPENGTNKYATATTLCNLGYLYRYRDMHSKAADVLREALDLQEEVLGKTNATVLSTLDNLADSCANAGSYEEALRYYQDVLRRFESGPYQTGPKTARAKSVLLYKMSRVYRKQNNLNGQLDHLKLSLRYLRSQPTNATTTREASSGTPIDSLERQILYDIRACRETLENQNLDRI